MSETLEQLKRVIESSSDAVLLQLELHLARAAGATAAKMRDFISRERSDRELCGQIFGPLTPLFRRPTAPDELRFPPAAARLLWRGLLRIAPDEVAALRVEWPDRHIAPIDPARLDRLVALSALALQARDVPEFGQLAELCETADAAGAERLAGAMRLAPLVRAIAPKLESWTLHPDQDTAAAARLAYRDATSFDVAAGPLFFEMIAGQLAEPWRALRVISQVMDLPPERYLAQSEAGPFAERLLAAVDQNLAGVAAFHETATDVDLALHATKLALRQLREMQLCVRLDPQQPWGARVAAQRQQLREMLETIFNGLPKAIEAALPQRTVRSGLRRRSEPALDATPLPAAIEAARGRLRFIRALGPQAEEIGVSVLRAQLLERHERQIEAYVETALHQPAPFLPKASALLHAAGELLGAIRPDAAELVRRRAAAAMSALPAAA